MWFHNKLADHSRKFFYGIIVELLGAAIIIFLGWLVAVTATGGRM